MDLVLANYMEKIIDYGIQTSNIDNVIKYGLIMVAVLLVGVSCGILSGVFTNITSYHFANDLRIDVYKKIMNLSVNQIDDFQTGSLVTRVTNDITQIQNMISMTLRGIIRAASFFVLGIIFTLSISSRFGIILAILLPVEIIFLLIFIKLVFPVFGRIQQKLDKVNTVVHENVSGARVVKAFSKEDYEYTRFVAANDEYTGLNLYVSKISALLMPILTILVNGAQVVIYYIGGNSIFDGFKGALQLGDMIKVGEISQAITYISMICMSIIMLGMTFANMAKAFASSKRVNDILDTKIDLKDGTLGVQDCKEKGTVEFKDVSFSYEEGQASVLNNISFKVNKGETVAIVGATGCGKSTLVNMIVRFYDPSSGSILVNGINVSDYKKEDLRNIVAICLQKSELFAGTIFDNISYGVENATTEEVTKAATIAQAMEFISSKHEGLNEYVEEKGTSLSGGQKQRLSIARAILKNPEILIFDDSTSALDLVTEAKLYQAMQENMSEVTKIVVAQRIATARNANRIIVMDNGSIVAFDTHDNLMEKCPIYKDIYVSQLKREEL